jgi:hypothetical protein
MQRPDGQAGDKGRQMPSEIDEPTGCIRGRELALALDALASGVELPFSHNTARYRLPIRAGVSR